MKKMDWKARLQNPMFLALMTVFLGGLVAKYAPGHESDLRNLIELVGYVCGVGAATMNPTTPGFTD